MVKSVFVCNFVAVAALVLRDFFARNLASFGIEKEKKIGVEMHGIARMFASA